MSLLLIRFCVISSLNTSLINSSVLMTHRCIFQLQTPLLQFNPQTQAPSQPWGGLSCRAGDTGEAPLSFQPPHTLLSIAGVNILIIQITQSRGLASSSAGMAWLHPHHASSLAQGLKMPSLLFPGKQNPISIIIKFFSLAVPSSCRSHAARRSWERSQP